ncbi:hypothetical protein [Mycolicibacter minnesotensis]
MATRATPMRAALSLLLLCFLMTSCGLTRQSMDIDYNDQRLNEGLENLLHQGKSGRLSDFTSWPWDEVLLFHEYAERESIEKAVGAPVIRSNFFESKASLLVFKDHGKPVKAAGIAADYLRGQDHRASWPADVMLQPCCGGYLQLTLPQAGG